MGDLGSVRRSWAPYPGAHKDCSQSSGSERCGSNRVR